MLTCPHCKSVLSPGDVAQQQCPRCQGSVRIGEATVDLGMGERTIDVQAPAPSAKPLTVDNLSGMTVDLSAPPAPGAAATVVAGPEDKSWDSQTLDTPGVRASDTPASSDSFSPTIDSVTLPPPSAAAPPASGSQGSGNLQTLDSGDPPGGSRSSSGSDLHSPTIDSVALPPRKPGSTMSERPHAATIDHPSSVPDVDRRLNALWGSSQDSQRPHVSIRGSSQARSSIEENSTLIIRERALKGQSDQHIAMADYDLLGVLGEGGMGVVYNARQASVDREVAVKMLKPDMVKNEQQRRKFLSEAAVTGELDHPNIVPIYDLGQNAEGALFYSMKKVQGTPWSKVIGQKSLLDNLSILMKVADAIAFAHARGVVHRDLKPENIMLGDFGEVLVLDWGLAVATEGHRPTPNVSAAYNIAGTPAYMAPELAFGPLERIGRHSDIYLLGAILYEVITGKPPHTGKNARDCLKAAAKNVIAPTEKRGELVEIARKAMATEPAERHASVQALQDELRQYQAHSESIALCERAEQELTAAHQTDDYRDFARALFAYEESYALWNGNQAALTGISWAKRQYAASAHRKHDYDLGLSLVDPQLPEHAEIHRQLVADKQERDARQQRLKRARQIVVSLAAAVFLAVTVGIVLVTRFWLEADRQKENAVEQTKIAVREKQNADVQRNNADVQRQKADEQAGIARANETRAKTQEQIALAAQEKAEYEAYAALISMAAAKIDEHAFDQARQALVACQQLAAGRENLLGWEWRRLWYVVNQGSVHDVELPAAAECLAPSKQGELLATGGLDGVVRIFDAKTQQPVAENALGGKAAKICAVAFCPADESWLAVGTSDPARPLLLWNRQTQEIQPLGGSDGHTAAVVRVTFSRDGSKLLTASHDHTAKLWDRQTRQPLATYRGHSWWVWSAAFSPDESQVATASDDGTVRLWNAASGSELTVGGERMPFREHKGPVYAVAFQPPASGSSAADLQIASAGYDNRVLLWKPEDLKAFDFKQLLKAGEVRATPCLELRGHAAAVRDLAFSADGRRLLSASSDHTLCLWYAREEDAGYAFIRAGTLDKQLRGHTASIQAAAFSPADPQLVVSAGHDAHVKLWSTAAYHEQQALPGVALRGHVNAVMSARYSPDGRSLVTASSDRTAKKWLLENGSAREALAFREGHSYLTSRAIFFPDGQKLLTAAVDGSVRIWSRATEAELLKLPDTGYRAAAALSPDGRWILTGGQDNGQRQGAILWDAATGERRHDLLGHKVAVGAVAFSPDGQVAYTGDDNGTGNLWEVATGRHLARLNFHLGSITAAAFSPDGQRLFTASSDKTVCPWVLTDLTHPAPNPQQVLRHPQPVNALAVAPDGAHVVTGCEDGRTRLFDVQQGGGKPAWTSPELIVPQQRALPAAAASQSTNVSAVALSPDGRWLATVDSVQHIVRMFAMDYGQHVGRELLVPSPTGGTSYFLQLPEHDALAWSVTFAPDARGLVTVGGDEARLWDFQPDRELLRAAAGRAAGDEAWLWDFPVTESGAFGPHRPLTFAEFSGDGKQVITAGWDNSARLWDAATGQALLTLDEHSAGPLHGHTAAIHCARILPGGKQALTASEDATVRLWDLQTRQVVKVFGGERGHKLGVTRIVPSRDGAWFVSASRDGTAALWQVAGEAPTRVLRGHDAAVLDVALSADERYIVTASADRTARVWDAASGEELCRLAGHAGEVTAVAFEADARGKLRVLTGSTDLTAKIWDVDSLATRPAGTAAATKELLTLKGHSRALTSVAFSPLGDSVLTSARDGLANLWPAALEMHPGKQRSVQNMNRRLEP